MAATHTPARRPRKTVTRHRRLRLPRLGWGWAALALTAIAVARTWPLYTALAVALTAALLILLVVRPRRLAPILDRVSRIRLTRSPLPAPGRRTLNAFQRMRPDQFEHAIAGLAREAPGVIDARVVGQTGDRGADVLVQHADGRRILIQCKRYRTGNNVGSDTVQTTNGVYRDIHHCHQAAIVTTSGFTQAAYDTNALLPQQIRLVDGTALTAWANGTGHTPW
ncbi:restriction endonuclease [Streptomyces sp. NPDC001658]